MHRFFISPQAMDGETGVAWIEGREAHHLRRVLRLAAGDRVVVTAGQGESWEATVHKMEPERVTVRLLRKLSSNETGLELILAQGLPKGDKMDFILQKGTELGIRRFVPLVTERTVIRLGEADKKKRLERWQRIAVEASKQSGRDLAPEVSPVTNLEHWADALAGDITLIVPWEGEKAVSLKKEIAPIKVRGVGRVAVVVGPEGGLSSREIAWLGERGARTVSLGPRILRTETAAIVACALILYEYGELGDGG